MLSSTSYTQGSLPTHQQYQSLPYNTVESLLADVSRQAATSGMPRRHARSQSGHRSQGGMRVSKATSTNNSPLRHRMMTASLDQQPTNVALISDYSNQPPHPFPAHVTRPVSWHAPTDSRLPYYFPVNFGVYELPLTPTTYSTHNSPASSLTAASLALNVCGSQYPESMSAYSSASNINNHFYSPSQSCLPLQERQQELIEDPFYWDHCSSFGLNVTTNPSTPKTPDYHLTSQGEQVVPYMSPEEQEESDDLVGMGLYSNPSKDGPEPCTHYYSSLHYSACPVCTQRPTGKGLKLEETWVPSKEDDGEDEIAEESKEEEHPLDLSLTGIVPPNAYAPAGFTDSGKLMSSLLSQYGGYGW